MTSLPFRLGELVDERGLLLERLHILDDMPRSPEFQQDRERTANRLRVLGRLIGLRFQRLLADDEDEDDDLYSLGYPDLTAVDIDALKCFIECVNASMPFSVFQFVTAIDGLAVLSVTSEFLTLGRASQMLGMRGMRDAWFSQCGGSSIRFVWEDGTVIQAYLKE